MQRLFNINKWATLSEGAAMEFSGAKPRVVRLEVNAPSKVRLHLMQRARDPDAAIGQLPAYGSPDELPGQHSDDDTEVVFLALVEGRDTLEFHTTGRFSLLVEGGDCEIYSADGEGVAFVNVSPVIFTRITERRQRSPELEYIAAMMSRNMERRLDQQAAELRALYERKVAQPPLSGVQGHAPAVSLPDANAGNGGRDGTAGKSRKANGGKDDGGGSGSA